MRHYKSLFTLLTTLIITCLSASAQTAVDSVYNIVDTINASGMIQIVQPDGLNKRIVSDSSVKYIDNSEKTKVKDRGDEHTRYSIQIFSENKGQSSKKNAEYRKRIVEQRMPGMHGLVVYDSPYWRVRIGSFRTESEARAAEKEIKSKFPSFAGEIRIVRTRQ